MKTGHWQYTSRPHRCEVCGQETKSNLCEGQRFVKNHNDAQGNFCEDGSRRMLPADETNSEDK